MSKLTQTLQVKLLLTLMVGLTLMIVVAMVSIGAVKKSIDGYQALHKEESYMRTQVDAINLAFKGQVQEWKNVLLRGHDQSARKKYWSKFNEQDQKVKELTSSLLSGLPEGGVKSDLSQFIRVHESLRSKYESGLSAFEGSGFVSLAGDAAVKGIDREPSQLLSSLSDRISVEESEKAQMYSDASSQSVWIAVGSLLSISVVVLFGLNLSLGGQLIKPLREAVDDIARMSKGDFTHKLNQNCGGELGVLNQSLDRMKEDLGGMIAGIRTTANVLRQSSQEFRSSGETITQDTSKAENFSGQIAAAIAQMASTVTEVANNAANAAEATQMADKSANEGLSTMEGAIRAISDLAGDVSTISGDMSKLEQDTTSVGAVLDVIKGIAEQTNLLALNAAIEAARAGEQGRGFAVVADEVRALAKRTQESTEEIQHIIETVQTGAAAAAQAMQAGNGKAEGAATLAQDAGNAIQAITQSIGQIRDMNNQIAAASEQQSVAADEISRNVVGMSELAQNAHHSANSTRATTDGLEQTASDLTAIVARFQL